MVDQTWAGVPRRVFGGTGDVVTFESGDRHGCERLDANARGKAAVVRNDILVTLLVVIHQIHLVDGQHDVANADQVRKIGVTTGLRQHALASVDQDDGEVGGGSTGDHVARVLLVPRCVRDDELALLRGEEAVGHIDGDALLAFRSQAIHQQGKINFFALCAVTLGIRFQCSQLILKDHLRVVKQAANQG